MPNFKKSEFKADVQSKIKTNNSRAITGAIHQGVLNNAADSFLFYMPVIDSAARDELGTGDKYQGAIVWVMGDERLYFLQSDLTTWNKILTEGDVQSLINSSVSGTTNRIFAPVSNISELQEIDTTDLSDYPDNGIILVKSNGTYRFDRGSVTSADGDRIVAPTAGVGRWRKITPSILDHNELFNAQGGSSGQYYHLTSAQHALIQDTIDKRHTQNSDTILDEGNANEVSAAEIRDAIDNDITELQGWVTRLFSIQKKGIDYQITLNDRTILVDASVGDIEIILPEVVSADGYDFIIKKIDNSVNTVTIISFESSDDGSQSFSITDPDYVVVEFENDIVMNTKGEIANLQSDGEDWYLIA